MKHVQHVMTYVFVKIATDVFLHITLLPRNALPPPEIQAVLQMKNRPRHLRCIGKRFEESARLEQEIYKKRPFTICPRNNVCPFQTFTCLCSFSFDFVIFPSCLSSSLEKDPRWETIWESIITVEVRDRLSI